MNADLNVLGKRVIYTNDDEVNTEVVIKQGSSESSVNSIGRVEFVLACESVFTNGISSPYYTKFYESEPVLGTNSYASRGKSIYGGKLRFPSHQVQHYGTLTFDGSSDGIRWFIRATVFKPDGNPHFSMERECQFKPTAPPPELLNLMETELIEPIANSTVKLITTHSDAGLPQVPLSTGIGLTIKIPTPKLISVQRLRFLLNEYTEVEIDGNTEQLPVRRWLLKDCKFFNSIKLDNVQNNLDSAIGDIKIDHSTLTPSFSFKKVVHSFDLQVEATFEWEQDGSSHWRKIISVNPVDVLPRISGSKYPNRRESVSNEEVLFDPAEVTDTSDEESDEDEVSTRREASEGRDYPFLLPNKVASNINVRQITTSSI